MTNLGHLKISFEKCDIKPKRYHCLKTPFFFLLFFLNIQIFFTGNQAFIKHTFIAWSNDDKLRTP